jgi:hypothetical protein
MGRVRVEGTVPAHSFVAHVVGGGTALGPFPTRPFHVGRSLQAWRYGWET